MNKNRMPEKDPRSPLKKDFLRMYAEIEFNATEDSIFERVTLQRLQEYSDKHFGTHLNETILQECSELREWFFKGHSEEEWRKKIREKRIKEFQLE